MGVSGAKALSRIPTERRAHQRIETNVALHGAPDEGGVVARMTASNLSLGGLQCTSASGFPEMTRLAVRMMLPTPGSDDDETEPLDLEAVVVRCEEVNDSCCGNARFRLALFFTGLEDPARDRLAEFIGE
jgi:hypothetical protein